ncbi:hypothetical protein V8E51_019198 [Hyaloscypha variabilis]
MNWRCGDPTPLSSFASQPSLVLQLFQPSSAQYTARFQYPTGGEVYNVLDTVVVQWTSNYASTTLFTWIWDVTSDDGQEGALQISFPSYKCHLHPSEVQPANDHKTDSLRVLQHAPKWLPFLQALRRHTPSRHTAGVNGKWFNVTSSAAAPTTWSLGSDSLATTTTTLSSSSPTSTPSTSASPSSAQAHSSGLGDGAIAGMAVWIAVLVVVVAFAVFWAVRSHRRLKALERNQQENLGLPELKYELGAGQEGQARNKSMLDASSGLAPDRQWVGEPWTELDAIPARKAELGS